MACVKDIDWNNPIEKEYKDINVTLDLFGDISDPILGYVKFKFSQDTRYPTIPINVDGCIVYPLFSKDEYVYATGFEIYLALILGAEVYGQRIIKLRKLMTEDGEESHCLREMVKDFIKNRELAKTNFGSKSLEQLLIKLANNALYGKTAQNIVKKRSWNAKESQMVEIGSSQMTSPYHATMITAIVRCVLIAAMNQVEAKGYHVYSVTTDGFICSAPLDVIKSLDLYGFKSLMESSRYALTGSKDIWEVKHTQHELLNITTRGNVGFNFVIPTKASFDDGTQNGDKRVAITDYNKRLLQSCVMAIRQGVEIKALGNRKAEI